MQHFRASMSYYARYSDPLLCYLIQTAQPIPKKGHPQIQKAAVTRNAASTSAPQERFVNLEHFLKQSRTALIGGPLRPSPISFNFHRFYCSEALRLQRHAAELRLRRAELCVERFSPPSFSAFQRSGRAPPGFAQRGLCCSSV